MLHRPFFMPAPLREACARRRPTFPCRREVMRDLSLWRAERRSIELCPRLKRRWRPAMTQILRDGYGESGTCERSRHCLSLPRR